MVPGFQELKLSKEVRPTNDFSYNIESVREDRGRSNWFSTEVTKAKNLAFTAPRLCSLHFSGLVFSV